MPDPKPYQTKSKIIPFKRYGDIKKEAFIIFRQIKRKTKRKPYMRSAYFEKQKIFFDYFWDHTFQKGSRDRARRLKYFPVALEVIKNTRFHPKTVENPNNKSEILHKFSGRTKEGKLFYVQIKEKKRTGKKYLMSIFPN